MSDRPSKYDFEPRQQTYGRLDMTAELVICAVYAGRLVQNRYPKSWADAVVEVDSSKPTPEARPNRPWKRGAPWCKIVTPRPRRPDASDTRPNPTPLVLLRLNAARDAYEVMYRPNDLGGLIDPTILLNFRRTI
jgi:hypothetical protein